MHESPYQFGTNMLGISGRSAIAEDEKFATCTEARQEQFNSSMDLANVGVFRNQFQIPRCLLEQDTDRVNLGIKIPTGFCGAFDRRN